MVGFHDATRLANATQFRDAWAHLSAQTPHTAQRDPEQTADTNTVCTVCGDDVIRPYKPRDSARSLDFILSYLISQDISYLPAF